MNIEDKVFIYINPLHVTCPELPPVDEATILEIKTTNKITEDGAVEKTEYLLEWGFNQIWRNEDVTFISKDNASVYAIKELQSIRDRLKGKIEMIENSISLLSS